MKRIDVLIDFLVNASSDASNSTKNLRSFHENLYSYSTLIAVKEGNKINVTKRKYSVTTSQHTNSLIREAKKRGFEVVLSDALKR